MSWTIVQGSGRGSIETVGTDSILRPELPARSMVSKRAGERHRALLEAVIEVIGHEGIDAVSHRRVADVAEVPLGSTTYYFASRDDMLVQSLAYFARGEIDALNRALGAVPAEVWRREGTPGLVRRLTELLAPQTGEDRWRTLAQYALFQEASRRPELRGPVKEWNEEWWRILTEVLEVLGRPHARIDAQMLLAMFDGLLLSATADPREDYIEEVLVPALERWMEMTASERVPTAGVDR